MTKEPINKSNSAGHSRAASTSPNFQFANNYQQQLLSIPDIPAALPLESINPISATSTVLSTSLSNTDLHLEIRQSESKLHVEYTETNIKHTYTESTNVNYTYSGSHSDNHKTSNNNLTTGEYHSFIQ